MKAVLGPHFLDRRSMVGLSLYLNSFTRWGQRNPIAAGYGMHQLWFSVFLVWAIKASLLRRGGLRAYRRAFPFFAGLIAGESVMMAAWAGINAALGMKFHTCTQ